MLTVNIAERCSAQRSLMSFYAAPTLMPPPLHLRRIDPDRNMARYYTLSVEITLFEDWSCTRAFGRIGSREGA